MKQAGYTKRPRGRSLESNRKSHSHNSAEQGKRKNPQSAVEKYLSLARDAASSGDPVSAENFYQYADHYYRMAHEKRASRTNGHRPPSKRLSAEESRAKA